MKLKSQIQKFSTIFILALLLVLTLTACQEEPSENENTDHSTETTQGNDGLLETKPEVREIEKNNKPNRIIATFNGDTKSQMGFNWYTTDLFEDSKVWVSTKEDMSDAIEFEAEATEVTNKYAERTKGGYFIFADLELDEKGKPLEDENGEPIINGYYTDEGKNGPEWMSGKEVGYLELVDVKEYSYKAIATNLKPNTTYYYQVGSETGEKSNVGTFNTSSDSQEAFTFVQYTDTQNAFWNENVRNEAVFGADTIKQALNIAGDADFVLHTGD